MPVAEQQYAQAPAAEANNIVSFKRANESQELVTVLVNHGGKTFFLTLPKIDLKFLQTEEGQKIFEKFSQENGFASSAYSIFDAPQAANENSGVDFLANAVLDNATAMVVEAKLLALHTIIEAGGKLTEEQLQALVKTVDQMTEAQRERLSSSVASFVKDVSAKLKDGADITAKSVQQELKNSLSSVAGSIREARTGAVDAFLKFTGLEPQTAPRENNNDTTLMVPTRIELTREELQMMQYVASQRRNWRV